MENQCNKKPIDEVVFLVKELKKDITELQTDISYIKKRLYTHASQHVEEQMKEEKLKPSSGWFGW